MRCRPARDEDRDAIRELIYTILREYGLEPDPCGVDADLAQPVAEYSQAGGCFDVLEDDGGAVVASVALWPLGGAVCELRKMYLRADLRGRGLGRQLLEHAIARARELGFGRIELETASVLVEARQLYASYGFGAIERSHMPARCNEAWALDLD